MNAIIEIRQSEINGAEVNAVNAREIHEFLEVKTHLSTWIKRAIEKYEFQENIDFSILKSGNPNGGIDVIDYIVTLDMAKELAMVENNPKGKEARRYFIETEKKARTNSFNLPQTFSEALLLAHKQAEQIERQSALLLEQKPKVDFFEAVTNSKTAIAMGEVAKVLDKNIGRNKLFETLRDKGILQNNNIPYQVYIDRGYFRVVEVKYTKPDGSTNISLKTLVYQKGVNFINKILEDAK